MPTVALDHDELVRGVQHAMSEQLRRDGRLHPEAELGLLFYAQREDDLTVVGTVRRHGQTQYALKGSRAQLSAVATQLALDKLPPGLRRTLQSTAAVHWRLVRLTSDDESIDRFMADVEFSQKA